MQSDPIADMLTRIRNDAMVQHPQVAMPSSNAKVSIARILADEGVIVGYFGSDEVPQPTLRLKRKYTGKGKSVITGLKRVSTPGRRVYTGFHDIPWVRSGLGINIISTPKGLMPGRRARRSRVGGEVLCNVW